MKIKTGNGKIFLVTYLVIFTGLLVITLIYPREEIHIFINKFHSSFLDELMKYWTYLGDGLVLAIVILFALLISYRNFFILLASFLISGIDSQILKRLIFDGMARPVRYFELHDIDYQLYLVPGIRQLSMHSFPSGHTAAAFSVFLAIALLSRSRVIQVLCFVLAFGVALSRVYLSQHFLMDVVAGSAVGVAGGWVSWYWMNSYNVQWLDRPLLKLIK